MGTPAGAAVVGHEDQDRVLAQPRLAQHRVEPADVLVDVGDHAEEAGDVRRQVAIGVAVAVGHEQRAVRGIGRDVGEERLAALCDSLASTASPRRRRRRCSSPRIVFGRRCACRCRRSSRCSSSRPPSRCARRGRTTTPGIRDPGAGRGRRRRGATCRTRRCGSRSPANTSAMVGRPRRSIVRPLLTFIAPLARRRARS